jgi:phosphonate transport system substrate-binding protein
MVFNLTVSPDFSPEHIAGWYIFNTWLQRQLGYRIHVELYDDFAAQRQAIAEDKVDIIFANPFDAAMLVRQKGFSAIATAAGRRDEVVIAAAADSPYLTIEDMRPGVRVSKTQDPDVDLIGMIMLEPADLNKDNIVVQLASTYVLVAKQLIQGKADIGFFLKEAYYDLSQVIRKNLRLLVSSEIHVVRHVLLVGPRFAEHRETLRQLLLGMSSDLAHGAGVLESLGFSGWESQSEEDTQFMIDLMDTLQE